MAPKSYHDIQAEKHHPTVSDATVTVQFDLKNFTKANGTGIQKLFQSTDGDSFFGL